MVCVPDLMSAYQQGAIDLETVQAVQLAMIAHCELMGDRIAILDPPPGPERPADQGVAGRQGRLRLEVRRPLLAVGQGLRPGHRAARLHAAARPHRRHLGPQRRHPRRAQGAGQRGRPRRDRPRDAASPRTSTTCSTRSASTASAPSPAAASGSGAPAPCPPTRPGATSTSAGCSTTSRSRSSTAPSGSSSSRTTTRCGPRSAAPSPPSWSRSGARARCSARRPDEAFYVKCDGETNPAEGIDAGQVRLRDRRRTGEAGRVRDLPAVPVLRRHQPGHRVVRLHSS